MKQERLLQVLISPHVSEKSAIAAEKRNEHVFEVVKTATKAEIKDAVELLFSTKVKTVRIVNVRPKKKTFKGRQGSRQAWKKAYVTLLPDQKLEIMGAQ